MIVTLTPLKEDRYPFPTLQTMNESPNNDHKQSEVFLVTDHGVAVDSNFSDRSNMSSSTMQRGQSDVAGARVMTASISNNTFVSTITAQNPNIATNVSSPSSRRGLATGQRNILREVTADGDHYDVSSRPLLYGDNSCPTSPSANPRRSNSSSSGRGVPTHFSLSSSRGNKQHAPSIASQDDDYMMNSPARRSAVDGSVEEDGRRKQGILGRKRSISSTSNVEDRTPRSGFSKSTRTPASHLASNNNNNNNNNSKSTMMKSGGELNYQEHQGQGFYVHSSDMHPKGTAIDNRFISSNYVIRDANGAISSVPREQINQGATLGHHIAVLRSQQGGEMTTVGDPHRHHGATATAFHHQPSFSMASSSVSNAPIIFKAHQIMMNSPHFDMAHVSATGANPIYIQGGLGTGGPKHGLSVGQAVYLNGNVHHPAPNQQLQDGLQFVNGNHTFYTQRPQLGIFETNMKQQHNRVFQDQQQQNNQLSNSAIPVQWMNYHSSIPSDPYVAQAALMAARQQQQQTISANMLMPSQMIPSSVQQPFLMNNPYSNGFSNGLMNVNSISSTSGGASASLHHKSYIADNNRDLESSSRGSGAGYQGKLSMDHHSNRNIRTLETSGDSIWLSEFLCFLRSECCEVFTATDKDVQERRKSKQINLKQVGIRCRFCAHLPHNIRVGRSSCFPSSVDRIYQSVTMMIREHFPICEQFPDDVRRKYIYLKKSTKKGEMESKAHWKRAARELGMVDTPSGIYFENDLADVEKETKEEEENDLRVAENDGSLGGDEEVSSVGNITNQVDNPSAASPEADNMTAL